MPTVITRNLTPRSFRRRCSPLLREPSDETPAGRTTSGLASCHANAESIVHFRGVSGPREAAATRTPRGARKWPACARCGASASAVHFALTDRARRHCCAQFGRRQRSVRWKTGHALSWAELHLLEIKGAISVRRARSLFGCELGQRPGEQPPMMQQGGAAQPTPGRPGKTWMPWRAGKRTEFRQVESESRTGTETAANWQLGSRLISGECRRWALSSAC